MTSSRPIRVSRWIVLGLAAAALAGLVLLPERAPAPIAATRVSAPPVASPAATVLEFFSGACSACLKLAPIIGTVADDCTRRGVAVRPISVDDPANEALAERYAVRGLPTVVVLDGRGDEVARFVGVQSLDTILDAIDLAEPALACSQNG